jgi:phage/plasmid-like protein (TIGR03299 family)
MGISAPVEFGYIIQSPEQNRYIINTERIEKMAHMIDTTTGMAAIAYAGAKPWHGLGQALTPDASIETWTREAGLDYTVKESPVLFQTNAATMPEEFKGRKVLHRSDTGGALAVVSDGYRVVQPADVMGFFGKLVELGGFQMETAGVLSHGRRVWALAKVNEGADIVEGDTVRPYVLLGTSYDGTMATVAKFTSIRVVCNNTITAALGRENAGTVRVLHSERFNPDAVRMELGIVGDNWERFLIQSRKLSGEAMGPGEADQFVQALLQPYHTSRMELNETRGYRRIMELFNGQAIGANIPGVSGTRWAMLNAVTELVDHERGRSNNTRMESAWFGTGAALKNKALELLAVN